MMMMMPGSNNMQRIQLLAGLILIACITVVCCYQFEETSQQQQDWSPQDSSIEDFTNKDEKKDSKFNLEDVESFEKTDQDLIQNNETNSMTYERVVLDGTKISLSCPHMTTIEPHHMQQEELNIMKEGYNEQKDPTFMNQQTVSHQPNLALRVRWFRNHVPLLNLNHSQFAEILTYEEASAATNPKRANAEFRLELNQTTTRLYESKSEEFKEKHEQDLLERSSFDSLTSENVNELAPEHPYITEQQSTFGDQHQWYVSKFGELVINKVSQQLAGRYTCLVEGRKSELLLDVLANKEADSIHDDQALKLNLNTIQGRVGKEQIKENKDEEKLAGEKFSSFKNRDDGLNPLFSTDLMEVYHEAGNDQFNRKSSPELSTNAAMPSISSPLDVAASKGEELKFDREDNSQVDNNSSIEFNSIKTSRGSVSANYSQDSVGSEQLLNSEKKYVGQNSDEKTTLRDKSDNNEVMDGDLKQAFPPSSSYSSSALEETGKINFTKLRPSTQHLRHPVQIVKTETILADDLNSMPGFFYTKQLLHCPIDGTLLMRYYRESVFQLIRAFCPKHDKTPREMVEQGAKIKNLTSKCYNLAKRLISLLFREQSIHNCSPSLLEIIWFKENAQLEFDSEGRGLGENSNLKLINSLDQFRSTNINRDNDNSLFQKSKKRVKMSYNISSQIDLSNKWIEPFKRRTLEIYGIRKDSSGRYTCALELSIHKLDTIIQRLRQLNLPNVPLKWTYHVSHVNDKLCRDELSIPKRKLEVQPKLPPLPKSSGLSSLSQIERNKTIIYETFKGSHSHDVYSEQKRFTSVLSDRASNGDDANFILLNKPIALLESILNSSVASEFSLDYITEVLSRQQNPSITIQTFSLVITERNANSSDLWSTIVEAENAYTRRKLADLKRFRRDNSVLDGKTLSDVVKPVEIFPFKSPISSGTDEIANSEPLFQEQQVKPINENPVVEHLIESNEMSSMSTDERNGNQKWNDYSNQLHLMPGNNDKRTTDRLLVDQHENNLPTKSGYEAVPGFDIIKVARVKRDSSLYSVVPLNYANKKILKPTIGTNSLGGRDVRGSIGGNNVALSNRELSRLKRMSLIKGDHDYLETSETKDLITRREDSKRRRRHRRQRQASIVKARKSLVSRETNNEASLEIKGSQREGHSELTRGGTPTVIDDVQNSELSSSIINDKSANEEAREGGREELDLDEPELKRDKAESIGRNRVESYDPRLNVPNWMSSKQRNSALESAGIEDKSQTFASKHYSARKEQPDTQLNELIRPKFSIYGDNGHAGRQSFIDTSNTPTSKLNGIHSINFNEQKLTTNDEISVQTYDPKQIHPKTEFPNSDLRVYNAQTKYDDELDASLMWTASQYLYMHMKASVSSMFGVEVDVEWSNERINNTNTEFQEILNSNRKIDISSGKFHESRTHNTVPFATIDVISGQNLLLECTAQALGRLPEIKWYKRINSIPSRAKHFINLARKIAHELYWPLTELDLLKGDSRTLKHNKRFVCSESTTIFDNLANQTFTVINSLQLNQYNDVAQPENLRLSPLSNDNYNLYACIVDADIRHNFATLGVHFREASRQLPFEISKRLRARSAVVNNVESLNRHTVSDGTSISNPKDLTEYDLFRDNTLNFPMKSYWIPIINGSAKTYEFTNSEEFKLTPTLLSIIIMLVFGSLIVLIYLTLHSYKALFQLQFEEELDSHLVVDAPNHFVDDLKHEGILLESSSDLTKSCQCLSKDDFDQLSSSQNILTNSVGDMPFTSNTEELGYFNNHKPTTLYYNDPTYNLHNPTYFLAESSLPSSGKNIRLPSKGSNQYTSQESCSRNLITLQKKNNKYKEFNL